MSTSKRDVAEEEKRHSAADEQHVSEVGSRQADTGEDENSEQEQEEHAAGQGGDQTVPAAVAQTETLADENDEEDEDEIPYPEPEDNEPLLPPPDFRPFFTVIEDDSGEHHHPTVHYVFADDEDTDILTNAAMQTLNDSEQANENEDPNERFVVLDLDPTGKEIVSAVSLSPDWQALKTQVSPAPSWGGDNGQNVERGLMLRVSGQEASRKQIVHDKKRKGDVEGLLRTFDEHMGSLDGVLGLNDKDTHEAMHEEGEGGEGAA